MLRGFRRFLCGTMIAVGTLCSVGQVGAQPVKVAVDLSQNEYLPQMLVPDQCVRMSFGRTHRHVAARVESIVGNVVFLQYDSDEIPRLFSGVSLTNVYLSGSQPCIGIIKGLCSPDIEMKEPEIAAAVGMPESTGAPAVVASSSASGAVQPGRKKESHMSRSRDDEAKKPKVTWYLGMPWR